MLIKPFFQITRLTQPMQHIPKRLKHSTFDIPDIHIPNKFQKLLLLSSKQQQDEIREASLNKRNTKSFNINPSFQSKYQQSRNQTPTIKILQSLPPIEPSKPLFHWQKRLLSNIKSNLIDILHNDPLPKQLSSCVDIVSCELLPSQRKCVVKWKSMKSLTDDDQRHQLSDLELGDLLEKYGILFRELISSRLGHGVCSPSIPPLIFRLDQSATRNQEIDRRFDIIEKELSKK